MYIMLTKLIKNINSIFKKKEKKISLALLCIDYRFWPDTLPKLEKKYGRFDLIEIAGASKNLISPQEKEDKETLLENIKISIKLHHPERIILTNHTDCGAYGGSKKFTSHRHEIAFHRQELQKAKQIIKNKFKKLKVDTLIIDKDKKGKILLIKA